MNIIRKALLKLARGVAREDVPAVSIPEPKIVRVGRPVVKINKARVINRAEILYRPLEDIINYTQRELAQEIGEKMQEMGLICYRLDEVEEPSDEWWRDMYTVTAEAWAVKREP